MAAAALWALVGPSALVIGAVAGTFLPVSRRLVGLVMGFGAGALISAVACDLVVDAYREAGRGSTLDARRTVGGRPRLLGGRLAARTAHGG